MALSAPIFIQRYRGTSDEVIYSQVEYDEVRGKSRPEELNTEGLTPIHFPQGRGNTIHPEFLVL